MKLNKKEARLRRAKKVRIKIRELSFYRLCVYRTPKHIYAQIISPKGDEVIASASTLDKVYRKLMGNSFSSGNIDSAIQVGKNIAIRSLAVGIKKVAFDRSGFKYHGRIKALADAARENGLIF